MATILAITGDYNLADPQEYDVARGVLLGLAQDTQAEEATGFNPSGIGIGIDEVEEADEQTARGRGEASVFSDGDPKSNDGLTSTSKSSRSPSSVSARSSKTSTYDLPQSTHDNVFDGLGDDEKEQRLAAMFSSLKPIDVKLALRKTKGDASLAIDELLNLQWLEDSGERRKGIDGFEVADGESPARKKKGKKKKRSGAVVVSDPTGSSTTGLWEQADDADKDHEGE